MRARLAFGLSLAVDFDFLLIDEIVSVGDQRFRDKCHTELHERRKDAGFHPRLSRHGLHPSALHPHLIHGGTAEIMPSVEEAIEAHCAQR